MTLPSNETCVRVISTIEINDERIAAIKDAVAVLRSEANQLARLSDEKVFENMHYRVTHAVSAEISRLRYVGAVIEAMIPEEQV